MTTQPPPRYPVLATDVSATTTAEVQALLRIWIAERSRHAVHICTTHTTLEAYDDAELCTAINGASLALPDGMPLVWGGKWQGQTVSRVYGPDLMLAVCRDGLTEGYRHFLYGSTPDTLAALRDQLEARLPGLNIAGSLSPPFRPLTEEERAETVRVINEARADIVWVGLGTPRQDDWLRQFRPLLDAPVLIAVGAAFDFHAGKLPQAPRWMMRTGLEWLFRLCSEPQRLWRRYLLGNPRFIALSLWQYARGRGRRLQARSKSGGTTQ